MRYLLDKSVVRRCLKGLVGGVVTDDVRQSLRVLTTYSPDELFISLQTLHILRHIVKIPQTHLIIARTSLLYPVKYTKRWAKRLRETTFSREDAYLLSLATFGTDHLQDGRILGVHGLITTDLRLQNHFLASQVQLENRLQRMTAHLAPPYDGARLPTVYTPNQSINPDTQRRS
jgi:hypothetical protein